METLRDVLAAAAAELSSAGVASPWVDAELLLCHVLDAPRSALVTLDTIQPDQRTRFAELVRRRAGREPLQHLVGTAPFRHLDLAVGPGVFIPRPETELLVDEALRVLTPNDTVVDLCAGSGALGLAVLDECPGVSVIAIESDREALEWLRRNAEGTALDVIEGDVADPNLLFAHYGLIDVVLSNPPYVPELAPVGPEVLADPRLAVFAGIDGLSLLPAVIARAAELLHIGGLFVVEHDDTHATAILELLDRDGRWADGVVHRDLAGRPRYATASRAEAALDQASTR